MNAGNKNTPGTHHPRRRNVTTLMVGLKKRSHTQKSHPKVVNPRDIAGERKKKKEKKKKAANAEEENPSPPLPSSPNRNHRVLKAPAAVHASLANQVTGLPIDKVHYAGRAEDGLGRPCAEAGSRSAVGDQHLFDSLVHWRGEDWLTDRREREWSRMTSCHLGDDFDTIRRRKRRRRGR